MAKAVQIRFLVIFLCYCQVYLTYGQRNDSGDTSLIEEIFGTPASLDGEYVTPGSISTESTTETRVATDDGPCECVSFIQCYGHNQTIKTSGEGIIDIRLGQCPDSLAICCKVPVSEPATVKPLLYPPTEKCGTRNFNGVGFRIATPHKEAQFGEFPWMVALLRTDNIVNADGPRYSCGGSLIHLNVVLTGTHCVNGLSKSNLVVRAGEWDSRSLNEIIPYQEREIEEIVVHDGFSSGTLSNNIALLFLKEPFEYRPNVDIVCLPQQGVVYNDTNCVATGWGKDKFGIEGVYQNILKKVDLPLLNRKDCIAQLRTTRLGIFFQLHESFICAGGKVGEDTCEGDGGSPLVCPLKGDKDHYHQVGIVSWGIGCGGNIPAVYTNVPLFRRWIDQQLKLRGLYI